MNKANKIFNLLLLTLSLGAILMTIKIPAYITPSSTFNGAYEVIAYTNETILTGFASRVSREVIPCANLATARTIKRAINSGTYNEAPKQLPVSVERSLLTSEQLGGCRTGGLGYDPAVTWANTGRVERVHNWGSARSLASRYPVT